MGKNIKFYTKLVIGFIVIFLTMLVSLYCGYTSAATIVTLEPAAQEEYLSNYAYFTAILFVIVVTVIAGIAFVMSRTIRLTTKNLRNAANALAEGNVDVELVKRYNDEFGEVIDDFQKVVDNTRYQAQIAQEVADGNMIVDVEPRCEKDLMGLALQQMVAKNRSTLTNIKEAVYQVTTSSSQVASASEALAQGSTEQASAIEEITASIDDVAEKTKQNASQANAAADMMSKTIGEVQKGNEEMQRMVMAMLEINDASENISKIIKVIDDIAFQTNILALNAAVEAARAGDAGKGFAVVAEEVRNLAAKSSAAAAETAEMIQDSMKKVEIGTAIANTTAVTLDEITEVVKKSEGIVTQIAEASNYQATAIAQIDRAIEQVSQVVQNNSATSEQCAAASVELSGQASRMRDLISVYKLDDNMESYVDEKPAMESYGNVSDNEQIISLGEGFGKY
ncbi:MAG: methyl-accepting chemotaxis protein [Lachnospiraceae bacterium]|nr:methyl-accepting chemotaxis protein [Lachnospiraceae bacterium]